MKYSLCIAALAAGATAVAAVPCNKPDYNQDSPAMCSPIPGKTGVERVMTKDIFDSFFAGAATDANCSTGAGFRSWDKFVAATKRVQILGYPVFNTGDFETDRRELAAFLANAAHETGGEYGTPQWQPCGAFSMGLCHGKEMWPWSDYCEPNANCAGEYGFNCPCSPGKTYVGRGPIQLSWNYNYAKVSKWLFHDENILLNDPDMVYNDPDIGWSAALYFWVTETSLKPSCHQVMTNTVALPAGAYQNGFRLGFGMTINIINGGIECGCSNFNDKTDRRRNYYDRFTSILGIHPCAAKDHSLHCSGSPSLAYGFNAGSCSTPPSTAECASYQSSGDGCLGGGSGVAPPPPVVKPTTGPTAPPPATPAVKPTTAPPAPPAATKPKPEWTGKCKVKSGSEPWAAFCEKPNCAEYETWCEPDYDGEDKDDKISDPESDHPVVSPPPVVPSPPAGGSRGCFFAQYWYASCANEPDFCRQIPGVTSEEKCHEKQASDWSGTYTWADSQKDCGRLMKNRNGTMCSGQWPEWMA